MGTTYLHAVASLDGYIADERDDVGPLHDWYFNASPPRWRGNHASTGVGWRGGDWCGRG